MREHLASLVADFRRHAPETAVVSHRGVRRYATTYGELAELAGRFAAELERRAIRPGERVVLWGADSAEWIGVFFGCLLRGVVAVPLDAAGDAAFAARVVRDVEARLVAADAHLLAALESFQLPVASSQLPTMELRGIAQRLTAPPLWTVSEAVTLDTPFQIVFTSGTTSQPRGVVHTHRNVLVTLDAIEREIAKYRRLERPFHPLRFLHSLPLSHVFGQFMGLWCPALLAAEVHFAEQMDPARMVDLVKRERISVLVAVPRVLHLLRAHLASRFGIEDANLEAGYGGLRGLARKWWRWRRVHRALGWKFWAVISGGATLPADLEAFWIGLGFALIQGYGMTETTALVTLNHPFHIAPGTIGKTLPGREVKIGPDGEILVRGPMLAPAVWEHGAMRRREGEWLATGDLAEQNAGGELKFAGRKSDVIVTGAGMNVHPADLEKALAAQSGVRACAVVGCEFASGPEAVAVLLLSGTDREIDAAVKAANAQLAEYQQIRHWLRWPELTFPYTSTGKLIRRKVAEWACSQGIGNSEQAIRPEPGDALVAAIAEVTGESVPRSRDTDALRLSEDLKLDSLGRVQLQSALEQRFDVELEDDALAEVETVGELRKLIEAGILGSSMPAERPVTAGDRSSGSLALSQPTAQEAARPAGDQQQTTNNKQPATEDVYPRWPFWWWVRWLRVAWIEAVMRPLVWLLAKPKVQVVTEVGTTSGALGQNIDSRTERVTSESTNRADFAGNERPSSPQQTPYTEEQTTSGIRQAATAHSLEPRTSDLEPALIVCNHISAYDGALVLYALPGPLRRRVACAMSGEMLRDFRHARGQGNRLLDLLAPGAWFLLTALFNVFPLPRSRGFRRSFAHAGAAMDGGYSVLVFPEGARSRDGKLHAFRPGIGLLAKETGAAVLPVALRGLYEYTPGAAQGRRPPRWFHAGQVEVRIGAPVPAAGETTEAAEITTRLEQVVRELADRS